MNWMKRHLIFINMVWASALMLMTCTMFLGSCTSESGTGSPDVTPVVSTTGGQTLASQPVPTTQDEITFNVTGDWNQEASTRVVATPALYTDLDVNFDHNGGTELGTPYIHIDAFYANTEVKMINNAGLFHFHSATTSNKWRFANGGDIVKYYWPIVGSVTSSSSINVDGHLDFFAYAPSTPSEAGVTVSYTNTTHTPVLTCDLPYDNQGSLKEFIYALSPDKTISDQEASGGIPLSFMRPFSAILFSISSAKQRLTLKTITFKRIYYQGTSSYNSSADPKTTWTPSGTVADHVFTINDTMGDTMYTGSTYGPFIVMPQNFSDRSELADIKMVVTYQEYGQSEVTTAELPITGTEYVTGKYRWDAQKKYIYSLDLGSDDGQVKVYVTVNNWDDRGSQTSSNVD